MGTNYHPHTCYLDLTPDSPEYMAMAYPKLTEDEKKRLKHYAKTH